MLRLLVMFRLTDLRSPSILLACFSLFAAGVGAQSTASKQQVTSPRAEIVISTDTKTSHIGQRIQVAYQIRNVGEAPFYVPRGVEAVGWRGGFLARVVRPSGAKVKVEVLALDEFPMPGHARDIVKDIGESWILLLPGDFYGGSRPLRTIPMSAGRYQIVAEWHSPGISEEERKKLETLKFPVYLGSPISAPISVRIIK